MKTRMIKQMFACLMALVLMAGWAGFAQPTAVEAAFGESFAVTEAWIGTDTVTFTVTNDHINGYTDIREFAIGNNDATGAWVVTGSATSPSNLIYGTLAVKNEAGWQTYNGSSSSWRDLDWLDAAASFDAYNRAFLFTSWGYDEDSYSGYLETGFTDGYRGTTGLPASPFAAYSVGDGTITGETSVPIPGAVWLLGSGLFGLVAIRRRKKS